MSKRAIHVILLALWVLAAPLAQSAVVNINKANAAALVENLEGIGPQKASAIIAYRKSNGAFKSLDDLLNVKGIGAKTLQKNRRDLSLSKGATKAVGNAKQTSNTSTAKKKKSPSKAAAKKSSSSSALKKSSKKTSKKSSSKSNSGTGSKKKAVKASS